MIHHAVVESYILESEGYSPDSHKALKLTVFVAYKDDEDRLRRYVQERVDVRKMLHVGQAKTLGGLKGAGIRVNRGMSDEETTLQFGHPTEDWWFTPGVEADPPWWLKALVYISIAAVVLPTAMLVCGGLWLEAVTLQASMLAAVAVLGFMGVWKLNKVLQGYGDYSDV